MDDSIPTSTRISDEPPQVPRRSAWKIFFGQLIRYAANCFVVLGIKLVLVWFLTIWLAPMIAYFFVHIATFFISYGIHTRRTFRVSFSRLQLKNFILVRSFCLRSLITPPSMSWSAHSD